jgi:NIPSNAP
MQRRNFLTASMAATAAAATRGLQAQAAQPGNREFYQIRRYQLQSGPQGKLAADYFSVLIPALNRLGMTPVGALQLKFGPETPANYLIIPSRSTESLVTIDQQLANDEEFVKLADAFWNAPAISPAFVRVDSWLLSAFAGWPRLRVPTMMATGATRIFQLRTYESPSMRDHVRKIEMFHSGEFEVFKNSGAQMVFFGDTLIGSRMPSLTYMLSFEDDAQMDKDWAAFSSDPQWKKLQAEPRFGFEQTVSNISNLVLGPLPMSQI